MEDNHNHAASGGIGAGSVIAFIISYATWKSIWWAILHAIFGWAYILYFAIRYTDILVQYWHNIVRVLTGG